MVKIFNENIIDEFAFIKVRKVKITVNYCFSINKIFKPKIMCFNTPT